MNLFAISWGSKIETNSTNDTQTGAGTPVVVWPSGEGQYEIETGYSRQENPSTDLEGCELAMESVEAKSA